MTTTLAPALTAPEWTILAALAFSTSRRCPDEDRADVLYDLSVKCEERNALELTPRDWTILSSLARYSAENHTNANRSAAAYRMAEKCRAFAGGK